MTLRVFFVWLFVYVSICMYVYVCCCCQVASVVSDSVWPHGLQPTRLLCPWDSPGKNTGVGCHFLLQCVKVESESEVTQSCLTLSNPWTAAYQAPPSMGFSGQQYWSGVPLPFPNEWLSCYKSATDSKTLWKCRTMIILNLRITSLMKLKFLISSKCYLN